MKRRMLQQFVFVGTLASITGCNEAASPPRDVGRTPATDRDGDRPAEAPRDRAEPGTVGTAGERTGEAAARDTSNRAGAAVETADVKLALATADGIDATGINVDTDHKAKTVTLKGTVPTTDQRAKAEVVAQREATGYRITNQLVVRAAR